jgi:4-amino-4-deoxy-L-arabinose transferase
MRRRARIDFARTRNARKRLILARLIFVAIGVYLSTGPLAPDRDVEHSTNLHEPVRGVAGTRASVGARRIAAQWSSMHGHLVLGVVLVVLATAFQGSRPLYETDEGRYTDVALNMLDSHDWLVPRLDSEHPIFTKPPLTYWALAASFSALGRNEWAARLPNAIAFVATGFLVLGLARRFVPTRPWLGAGVWVAMLAPTLAANVVSTDTLLTLFETLAMYAWVRATEPGEPGEPREPRSRRWIVTMWLAWGLAMLTKGPVGLLPLVALCGALAAARDRDAIRTLIEPGGLVCFAVAGLGWYVWVAIRRPGVVGYFLGYELYDRIFTPVQDRHPEWYGAAYVYLPTLAFGALPWSYFVVKRVAMQWRRSRSGIAAKATRSDPDGTLLRWWLLLPLAVFALSRSRLPLYVLPLFVPLALLIARKLPILPLPERRSRAGLAFGWLLLLIGIKGAAAYYPGYSGHDARSFATRLSTVVDLRKIEEIAFVDATPFYGLRLYLDRNVERVTLERPAAPVAAIASPDLLCDELHARERTLYLVRAHERPQFERAVRACGAYRMTQIGQVQEFAALVVTDPASR